MTLISVLKSVNVVKEFFSVIPIFHNHTSEGCLMFCIIIHHFAYESLDLIISWLPVKFFTDSDDVLAQRGHVKRVFYQTQLLEFVQVTYDDHDGNHIRFHQPFFCLKTFYNCRKFFISCHSRYYIIPNAEVKVKNRANRHHV